MGIMVAVVSNPQWFVTFLFFSGWSLVFGFAVLGSATELAQGQVCPRIGEVLPLCYVSLLLSIVVVSCYRLRIKAKSVLASKV